MQQSPGYYVTPPPYFDKKKIDERKLELTKPTWSSRLLFHAKWIFLYIWVTALVTLIVLLSKFGSVSMPHTACRPDRTFSLYKENFSRWPRSTFFEVTVAGGSFSFTQAKMIDITWDLIVGRVGQAALAYFSWRAFSDYAAVAMETRPVNYSVFRTIFISQEASIGSLWCLIRNIRLGRAWRSTTAMCFVITSLAFTLAFPTLAGAITGYVAAVDAYIVGKDGLAIKFSDFDFVAYILRDGSLIYLGDNYLVPYHPTEPNVPPGGQLERG
ncbi:hypothetical protein QBC43DRAFT_360203 [Cladorrhinum sp. PSN259]|nr:hypothetical protein QBC43DRAFT_360203 [Cladorrhinum sp. PSN259]